jgi:hypothetical protein
MDRPRLYGKHGRRDHVSGGRRKGDIMSISTPFAGNIHMAGLAKSMNNNSIEGQQSRAMNKMKALVIDEPWITKILSGEKIWEMRKRNCKIRGPIALIKKGSGHVIGIAEITDCREPLDSLEDYAATERFHHIPPERQARAFADGWRTPWVIRNAKRLAKPIAYVHPSGAVIWVNLAPEVTTQIETRK